MSNHALPTRKTCTILKFHIYLFLHLVMLPLSNNEINSRDIAALMDLAYGCTLFDTWYQLSDFSWLCSFHTPWLIYDLICKSSTAKINRWTPSWFLRSIRNSTSVILCIWVDEHVLYCLSTSSGFIEVHIILPATKIIGSLFLVPTHGKMQINCTHVQRFANQECQDLLSL